MFAESSLRGVPGTSWDSAGWQMFLLMSKNCVESEPEKLVVWKSAIDNQHKKWTWKFREYAKSGGLHANYSVEEEQKRDETAFAADMSEWESVRIKRIERVDGFLKFFTDSGQTFEMPVEHAYSQSDFKRAFTIGTNIILPAIKNKSYQQFILSFRIEQVKNIGATLIEKIEEVFQSQSDRMKDIELADEKEAYESVATRSFAVYQGWIYFRITALLADLKKDYHAINMATVINTLRDMGAENVHYSKFNFWKYGLDSDNS